MRNTPSSPDTATASQTPPANRAERRAAARGRSTSSDGRPTAPRRTGGPVHTKPVRARTDFAARRSG